MYRARVTSISGILTRQRVGRGRRDIGTLGNHSRGVEEGQYAGCCQRSLDYRQPPCSTGFRFSHPTAIFKKFPGHRSSLSTRLRKQGNNSNAPGGYRENLQNSPSRHFTASSLEYSNWLFVEGGPDHCATDKRLCGVLERARPATGKSVTLTPEPLSLDPPYCPYQ
jgi:hypothetical protein